MPETEVDEEVQVAATCKVAVTAEVAGTAEKAFKVTVEDNSIVAEDATMCVNDVSDTVAVKAPIINKIDDDDNDCDVYIYTYWDNFKDSKAQGALDYFEKYLKQEFEG